MYEVEVKVTVMSPAALRRALEAAGARMGGKRTETDTFYADPEGTIVRNGEALRIRQASGAWALTYKGPAAARDVKRRREHEVACSDDPGPLLEGLGYLPSVRLTKTREAWDLDGVAVTIDTIDGLGTFAELEVVGDDPDGAEVQVETALKLLGLVGADRFNESYVELALAAGLAETL